jgi:predicted PurR-regulated permease PerM
MSGGEGPQAKRGSPADWVAKVMIAILFVALSLVLWRILPVLVLAFTAILLAVTLRTLALPVSRVTRLPERVAVLLTLLIVVGTLAAGVWTFGASIGKEAGDLLDQVTAAADRLEAMIAESRIGRYFGESTRVVEQGVSSVAGGVGRVAQGTFGFIADLVLVIFTAAYLALEPSLYRRGILRLLPRPHRPQVDAALIAVGSDLRRWLIGQLGAMIGVGVLTGVGLWLVGVPRALELGIIIGLFEFIPFIGPILGAVPGVLLALSQSPELALWAILVYVGVQQVEGNVIMPIAQRWAVHMPPAIGLLAIVAFGLLFGVPGVLIGTPLAVAIMRLVDMLYVKGTLERGTGAVEAEDMAEPERVAP